MGLDGKVAVVSGGSKGIGRAVVAKLAAAGASVLTASRTGSPELDELWAGPHRSARRPGCARRRR